MEAVKAGTADRTGDFHAWLKTTSEIKAHVFPDGVSTLADKLISTSAEGVASLDKAGVKARHSAAMEQAANLLRDVATQGDELVRAAGGLRAAVAAVRQAELRRTGTLPLDAHRLEGLRGLIGDSESEILQAMAEVGVPLLQGEDPPTDQSAQHSAGVLAYTAVGLSLIHI